MLQWLNTFILPPKFKSCIRPWFWYIHCILSFEGTSYKRIQNTACLPVPLFLVALHRIRFTSADIIFNIYWKKIFKENFDFLTNSPKPTTRLLSVTNVFCWCSLILENFWFYIWVVVLWLIFTTQMTLRHLLPIPMNKILDCKEHQIYSKILRKICIYVKRRSNISFMVIKNSSFNQRFVMVKTFLKILWWRFLVLHSEHLLVSSATLSCMRKNILTLSTLVCYIQISFF